MKHKLNREVLVRETGLVIQPELFWLAASPDGMVCDMNDMFHILGLLEIKCPKSKMKCTQKRWYQAKVFMLVEMMMVYHT